MLPTTCREIVPLPLRNSASVMVAGRLFDPTGVAASTAVANENVLSPAVASPFEPSSKNVCDAAPPMAVRSTETARPLLDGLPPGVTATVRRVDSPGMRMLGVAAPEPEGFEGPAQGASAVAVLRGFGV